MSQVRTVFAFSKNEAEVHEIQRMLAEVPGIRLQIMPGAHILEGRLALPFIEVDDTERFFGLESIKRFAQRVMMNKNST